MAKVYLDTNKVFDIIIRDPVTTSEVVAGHQVYTSPLSYHILCYTEGVRVPNKSVSGTLSEFEVVDLNRKILEDSLKGPTQDLEDNIQLHSAANASCDYFLTNDKKLLRKKLFGKTKIVNSLK